MTAQTLYEAAAARSAAVVTRADRPSRRRSVEGGTAPARAGARLRDLAIRSPGGDTGPLEFDGVATVYETGYEMYDWFGPYTEIVSAGAGAASLARADLDVPLVLQHADLRRIARTTSTDSPLLLSETDDGLQVLAPQLDRADPDVAYIAPKLRAGLIDEMSFRFMITSGQWSPDYMEYRINAYDIHRGDVAIVGYGANPATTANLRTQDLLSAVRQLPVDEARQLRTVLDDRLRIEAPAASGRSVDLAGRLLRMGA